MGWTRRTDTLEPVRLSGVDYRVGTFPVSTRREEVHSAPTTLVGPTGINTLTVVTTTVTTVDTGHTPRPGRKKRTSAVSEKVVVPTATGVLCLLVPSRVVACPRGQRGRRSRVLCRESQHKRAPRPPALRLEFRRESSDDPPRRDGEGRRTPSPARNRH